MPDPGHADTAKLLPATAVMRDVYTDVLTEKVIADTSKFGRVPVTWGDGRITKVG